MTGDRLLRRRTRNAGLAAGTAIAAVILGSCGTVTNPPASSPSASATSSPAAPPPSPSPSNPRVSSGFRVLSMSFVSDDQGFALGTVGCGRQRCLALLGTADGGRRWHRLAPPAKAAGAVYSTCLHGRPCVRQIRFATPLIGYAFSPSLLMTRDGGRRWRLLDRTGVSSLEAADGTVTDIAAGYEGCTGAPYRVESAPVGTGSWQPLPAPPIEKICPPVLYRQGERIVLAGYGNPAGGVRATAQVDRSADGGRTWRAGPDRCGGTDGYASAVALAPPATLAYLCEHQLNRPGGRYAPSWIRVSASDGAAFGPDRAIPAVVRTADGFLAESQLAAASSRRLLVIETGMHGSRLLRTSNGGRTWSPSLRFAGGEQVLLVGFEDPLTARIAQGNTVWTTTDGGRAWRADHFTPAA